MARIIDNRIVRTCRICQITEELIDFCRKKVDGKTYTLNVCKPCMVDVKATDFAKWWKKNKKERTVKILAWQKNNKDKVQAMRKRQDKKRKKERARHSGYMEQISNRVYFLKK